MNALLNGRFQIAMRGLAGCMVSKSIRRGFLDHLNETFPGSLNGMGRRQVNGTGRRQDNVKLSGNLSENRWNGFLFARCGAETRQKLCL